MLVGKNKIDIPPEILDRIFMHRERGFHRFLFLPKLRLYPLLFVCKEWHAVAEQRLYASVSLGSSKTVLDEDEQEIEIEGEEICEMFYDTVSENPRLASLVRELRLATDKHAKEETETHVELLELCENVERVEMMGYNGFVLDDLLEKLAKKENLKSLSVSRYGLRCMEGDCFFSRSDLIHYMLKWPAIEKIYMENNTLAWYDDNDKTLPKPATVAGRCHALKEFTVREDCLEPTHLNILARMAPAIQHLEISVRSESAAALERCIQTWAPTLRHLKLYVYGKKKCSLASVSSRLTELRYLNIASVIIPPQAFVHFKKLETATYFALSTDVKELTRIIQQKRNVPALRKITCDRLSDENRGSQAGYPKELERKLFPEAINALRGACKARGIAFSACFKRADARTV
ncbi:hypothetical protein SCHPADRAFT_901361 [Schizopora paradoxa]|uniref:Uncharacterized protein n=1 Tax=Schizopora paradoxa TaxID=27342 RepID=A0A0H2S4F0_9AGAM|nr:hypothetical protein SCHPADRAFT_901361 [Schizopora paradoxa]